jgi:hypothetical protein
MIELAEAQKAGVYPPATERGTTGSRSRSGVNRCFRRFWHERLPERSQIGPSTRLGRCVGTTDAMAVVRIVLARVYVDNLDAEAPAYRALAGEGGEVKLFRFRDARLAWIGPFLLLPVPAEQRADFERVATLLVADTTAAQMSVVSYGGEVLEGPADGPNGACMIARHADGSIFEYIADASR